MDRKELSEAAISFTRELIRSIWRDDLLCFEDQHEIIELAVKYGIVKQIEFDPNNEAHRKMLYSGDYEPGDPIWTWSDEWKIAK